MAIEKAIEKARAKATGKSDVLARAARLIRTHGEPGWDAIADSVIAAVRATPRIGWPLAVDDPHPGGVSGVLTVSDVVLSTLLSRALGGDDDYEVADIVVHSKDGYLQGISVDLRGRYLADLAAAAQRVSARVEAVVADVVGDRPELPVTVTVVDIDR